MGERSYEDVLEGRIQELSLLLADTCVWLEGFDGPESRLAWPLGLYTWWQGYRGRSKAHLEARKELIARLSPAERELLGISDRETFQLED